MTCTYVQSKGESCLEGNLRFSCCHWSSSRDAICFLVLFGVLCFSPDDGVKNKKGDGQGDGGFVEGAPVLCGNWRWQEAMNSTGVGYGTGFRDDCWCC